MREIVSTLLIAGSVAFMASAVQAAPKAPAQGQELAANAAVRYGVQANYTGQPLDVGYSADARHVADCLASFPNYDPKTDLVRLPSGEARPCRL